MAGAIFAWPGGHLTETLWSPPLSQDDDPDAGARRAPTPADDGGAAREPVFNVPWPVMTLLGALLAAFAVQMLFGVDPMADRFGFRPSDLADRRSEPLATALFLHGGWAHVLMNAAFLLAFGAAVSRRFGADLKGAAAFFGFYLVCGVLANLGYAALNPGSPLPVIGASGAVAGLMGAGSRLLGGQGELAPFRSQPVIGLAGSWLLINLLFGVVLKGWSPGAGGAPIAWQAHLAGSVAGLLLFSPALRGLRRRAITA